MAESEDGYRRGRVAADAREGQQGLVGGRDFPRVVAGDDRGGFVEAEGAAGIAQAAPLADRLTGGVGGLLRKARVKIVHGQARFRDGKTVVVEGTKSAFKNCRMKTG